MVLMLLKRESRNGTWDESGECQDFNLTQENLCCIFALFRE